MSILTPPGLSGSRLAFIAPRRTRLTKGLGGGLLGAGTISGISGGVPLTFVAAIPIEAPCYAVRLGFGNPYNVVMTVSKAAVVPSDSYSNFPTMLATQTGQFTIGPTGGAASSPVYFDNAGADVSTVNTAGTVRSFTLNGDSTNTGNASKAYTLQWSDFVPCVSIPRADGGKGNILFVAISISTASMAKGAGICCSGASVGQAFGGTTTANRGRPIYGAAAWVGGTDFADNITGTGYKVTTVFPPLVCLQYLTGNPGIQVVTTGDSLSIAPTNDQYSAPLFRAGCDLSTSSTPVEFAPMAWGGAASPVYEPLLRNNMAALMPSAVAYQPLSRNDGATTAILNRLFAQALADAATSQAQYGTKFILNMAGCEPSFDGNATAQAAFLDSRSRHLALAAQGVPVIDGVSVLGNVAGAAPWDYVSSSYSDDNTHPNYTGAELVVPLAKAALRRVIG